MPGKRFITADGREIAKVTPSAQQGPVGKPPSPEKFARAMEIYEQLRAKYGGTMTVEEVIECRDEGRR